MLRISYNVTDVAAMLRTKTSRRYSMKFCRIAPEHGTLQLIKTTFLWKIRISIDISGSHCNREDVRSADIFLSST